MLKRLLAKWFGILPEEPCETCEVLRWQLAASERERRELLTKLLEKDKPEPLSVEKEDLQPIVPQFVPWRVRQQMLEAEDRRSAQLIRNRSKEIDELEKEMGVNHEEHRTPHKDASTEEVQEGKGA